MLQKKLTSREKELSDISEARRKEKEVVEVAKQESVVAKEKEEKVRTEKEQISDYAKSKEKELEEIRTELEAALKQAKESRIGAEEQAELDKLRTEAADHHLS